MSEVTQPSQIESRKNDHVNINLEQDVSFPSLTTGLENYRFQHHALPELSLDEIDIRLDLFGKQLNSPVLISSMTGGADMTHRINKNLALAAQHHNIAMGVGSQRAAIADPALAYTFQVRDIAPDILLFANMGAVQLNYDYALEEMQHSVDMIQADALILHFNVLQEAVQPEGDTNFSGLMSKVASICEAIEAPVIAKEVGWGFSQQDVKKLVDAGISAIDVAGSGGTSWSEVEYYRAQTNFDAEVARAFADWGIPTAEALQNATQTAPNIPIFASGGLRNGIDIAKSIALGATLAGLASPLLKAANQSAEATIEYIDILNKQLRVAMLSSANATLANLQQTELIHIK